MNELPCSQAVSLRLSCCGIDKINILIKFEVVVTMMKMIKLDYFMKFCSISPQYFAINAVDYKFKKLKQ